MRLAPIQRSEGVLQGDVDCAELPQLNIYSIYNICIYIYIHIGLLIYLFTIIVITGMTISIHNIKPNQGSMSVS